MLDLDSLQLSMVFADKERDRKRIKEGDLEGERRCGRREEGNRIGTSSSFLSLNSIHPFFLFDSFLILLLSFHHHRDNPVQYLDLQ